MVNGLTEMFNKIIKSICVGLGLGLLLLNVIIGQEILYELVVLNQGVAYFGLAYLEQIEQIENLEEEDKRINAKMHYFIINRSGIKELVRIDNAINQTVIP